MTLLVLMAPAVVVAEHFHRSWSRGLQHSRSPAVRVMFVSAEAPLVWGFIDAAHELILASDPPRGCGVVRPNGLANL